MTIGWSRGTKRPEKLKIAHRNMNHAWIAESRWSYRSLHKSQSQDVRNTENGTSTQESCVPRGSHRTYHRGTKRAEKQKMAHRHMNHALIAESRIRRGSHKSHRRSRGTKRAEKPKMAHRNMNHALMAESRIRRGSHRGRIANDSCGDSRVSNLQGEP